MTGDVLVRGLWMLVIINSDVFRIIFSHTFAKAQSSRIWSAEARRMRAE
jgi:hypothetical protein